MSYAALFKSCVCLQIRVLPNWKLIKGITMDGLVSSSPCYRMLDQQCLLHFANAEIFWL